MDPKVYSISPIFTDSACPSHSFITIPKDSKEYTSPCDAHLTLQTQRSFPLQPCSSDLELYISPDALCDVDKVYLVDYKLSYTRITATLNLAYSLRRAKVRKVWRTST